MKQHFIKTSDFDTAQKLRNEGRVELSKQGEFYVFLNDDKQCFFEKDNKNVIFSNEMDM